MRRMRRAHRVRRPFRTLPPLALAGLFAALLVACTPSPPTAERRAGTPGRKLAPTRGYILISIDTLRADHVGAYGYGKPTTPFLDSLAARGVLFERAYTPIPATLPAHLSMFTGLYPGEHALRHQQAAEHHTPHEYEGDDATHHPLPRATDPAAHCGGESLLGRPARPDRGGGARKEIRGHQADTRRITER